MIPAALVVAVAVLSDTGYVRTRTSADGAAHCLWWPGPSVTFQQNVVGNTTTGPSALSAVTQAFATWQLAMEQCGNLALLEGAPTESRRIGYETASPNTNLVLFRFTSCAKKVPSSATCWQDDSCSSAFDCWGHGSALLGLTTVTYDTATGRILDADIELNAADHTFTTVNEPPCSGTLSQRCVATDVRNTMTHEVGHLLGLGHATAANSTMYAASAIGDLVKRTLDSATKTFVCEVYAQGLAPKDCVIEAQGDTLGPKTEAASPLSCGAAPANPWLLAMLPWLLGAFRRRWGMPLVALLVAVLSPTSAGATTAVALDVPRMTRVSDVVLRATVDRVEARWTFDHSRIVTHVHVVVLEMLKGAARDEASIRAPGGVVGRIGQRVEGVPSFEVGEEVVLFLEAQGPGFTLTGLGQGKFTVDRTNAREGPTVHQAGGDVQLLDAETARPIALAPQRLALDALRAQVRVAALPPEGAPACSPSGGD